MNDQKKKCDQQYHIKSFYSHSLHSSGLEESLNITMSVRPKLTRRRVTEETQETVQSRKVLYFNQKRCYTSLKENVDSKSCFFPTVIYFNSSRSHLSRGQRSPAVSTLIWGLATTTEQFSLMKTSMLKPLWHTVLYCIRAWVVKYVWLQMQPCFFQKILSIVYVALLLLPKCNTTVGGI